MTKMQIQN